MFKYLKLDLNLFSALKILLISKATDDLPIFTAANTRCYHTVSTIVSTYPGKILSVGQVKKKIRNTAVLVQRKCVHCQYRVEAIDNSSSNINHITVYLLYFRIKLSFKRHCEPMDHM